MGEDDPSITDEDLLARLRGLRVDHDTKDFYRGWLHRELRLNRCGSCGTWHHPPRPVCPACWSSQVVPTPVSGRGRVHLLIRLHQGPAAEGVSYEGGWPVATVELDEQPGLRFTSGVIGARREDLAIGRRVELAWIERGGEPYPVFRLDAEQN